MGEEQPEHITENGLVDRPIRSGINHSLPANSLWSERNHHPAHPLRVEAVDGAETDGRLCLATKLGQRRRRHGSQRHADAQSAFRHLLHQAFLRSPSSGIFSTRF